MTLKSLLPLLAALCLTAHAQQHIHVSPTGHDSRGDGSAARPFASLRRAYSKALTCQGSDTVFIDMGPGTYVLTEPVIIRESPQAPVVISGSTEGLWPATRLSGGISITGWEKTPRGYWRAKVPQVVQYGFTFEQLYVNGRRARRARTPDTGWFFVKDAQETVHLRGTGRSPEYATQRILADTADLKSLRGIGAEAKSEVMAMFFHKWDNTRKHFAHIVPDSGILFLNGGGMKPWNPITKGSRFVLENYRAALTAPGEWFLDRASGYLLYIPREGEDMTRAEVHAPCVPMLLLVQGEKGRPVRNVTFRHLAFEHAAYVMPSTGNDPEQAAASIPAAIHLVHANGCRIDNCRIAHTGNYGVWFRSGCTDCALTGSLLTDLGAGGVKIGEGTLPREGTETQRITVENNIIRETGRVLPCGVGVAIFQSAYNRVLHNEIANLLYSGVSVGWTWGYGTSAAHHNEVAYNHIHHIGWGELSDMGAVYTLGIQPGTHIHHNVIHDVYSYDYGGWGLYTDEGSTGIVMENNLVYGCKSGAFHQHYGRDNIIRNNIFAFSQYHQVQLTIAEKHRSFTFTGNIVLADCGDMLCGPWTKANLDMSRNLYWDLRTAQPEFLKMAFGEWRSQRDKGAVLADPLFVNPQAGNFSLKSLKNVRRVGFVPFDYTRAGVYGPEEWRAQAKMSDEDIRRFNDIVKGREKAHSRYYDR